MRKNFPTAADDTVLPALHFREAKVFVHTKSDDVLLRFRTSQPGDTWLSLHREDFVRLAAYFTENAASMHAGH